MTYRPLTSVLACLFIFSRYASARSPAEEPGLSTFVGNYGEVIKYRSDYQVLAKMHGAKEVVIFHPASVPLASDELSPPDFERYGLVELMVIPKGDTKFRSLEQLVKQRWYSLTEMNVVFTQDGCGRRESCTLVGLNWPEGTTRFASRIPFRLWQIYSETATEFYILSSGEYIEPGYWPAAIAWSLMDSLNAQRRAQAEELTHSDWLDMKRIFHVGWAMLAVLVLVFAYLPINAWKSRRRLVGLSALVFANGFLAYGLVMTTIARLADPTPLASYLTIGLSGVIVAAIMGGLAVRWLGAARAGRAVSSVLVGGIPLVIFCFLARADDVRSFTTGRFFSWAAMLLGGLIIGAAYGFALPLSREAPDGR